MKALNAIIGIIGLILGVMFLFMALQKAGTEAELVALGWASVMYVIGFGSLILSRLDDGNS